ncbi:MAG: twin-arginine translocase TatA/TatE family subunit [Candidatus Limnocylindrales bacterium]
MLEGLSPLHLILILAIALLVIGPGKLPETGAAIGRAVRSFRDSMEGREPASVPSSVPVVPAEAGGPATHAAPPDDAPVPPAPLPAGGDVTPGPPDA